MNDDRSHPHCHGTAGHTCQEPSGGTCVERGCDSPAGTHWGPMWCPDHDMERLDRVSASFEEIAAELNRMSDDLTSPRCVTCNHERVDGPRCDYCGTVATIRLTHAEQA